MSLGIFLITVVGISLSGVMAPGPITAATIAKGYHDKNAGMKIALGHAIVELPIILLLYYGFAYYISSPDVKKYIGLAGGLMLIIMGSMMFRTMSKALGRNADLPYHSITTGMILTGVNPYFLLWWATVGLTLITGATKFGVYGLLLFILVHWLCDLIWEQIAICAIVLIGFGIYYCISVFLG
jgi:threonine/homoserine/homoserine lactone efflux protein